MSYTIPTLTTGYNISLVNSNFQSVASQFNTFAVYSSGGQNVMGQDFDLNSHNLLNVNTINLQTLKINGTPVSPSTLTQLAPNSVGTVNIIPGSVTTACLASNVLTPYLTSVSLASTTSGQGAALIGWPSGFGITQPNTNQLWQQNGAAINRLDRVFIGGATVNDGLFPNVTQDWLTAYHVSTGLGAGNEAQLFVLNNNASPSAGAIEGGAQSLNFPNQYQSCIGTSSYVLNNSPTYAVSAWAYYAEAHRTTSQAGSIYGMEVDVLSKTPTIAPTPYSQGDAIGHQIGAGAGVLGSTITASISGTTLTVTASFPDAGFNLGVGTFIYGGNIPLGAQITALGTGTGGTGTYTLNTSLSITSTSMWASSTYAGSAAIQVVNNLVPWNIGINFLSASLTGCDGINGLGTAMALAKGHIIQWYANSTTKTGSIVGNGTTSANSPQLVFANGNLNVNSVTAGRTIHSFYLQDSHVNGVTFEGAGTNNSPIILASGTDANIDLQLSTTGTGLIKFGTFTSGAPTATGYVQIKTLDGTIRKVLVG